MDLDSSALRWAESRQIHDYPIQPILEKVLVNLPRERRQHQRNLLPGDQLVSQDVLHTQPPLVGSIPTWDRSPAHEGVLQCFEEAQPLLLEQGKKILAA
jgi:hypothetical protein